MLMPTNEGGLTTLTSKQNARLNLKSEPIANLGNKAELSDKEVIPFVETNVLTALTNLFNLRLNDYVRGKNLEDRKFAVTLLFKLIKNVNFTSYNDIKFDVFNIYKQLKDEFIKEPVEVRNKAKKLMSEILNYLIKGK